MRSIVCVGRVLARQVNCSVSLTIRPCTLFCVANRTATTACVAGTGMMKKYVAQADSVIIDQGEYCQSLCTEGTELCRAGSYAEALSLFDQVLAINPNHGQSWTMKGVACSVLHRLEEAVVCFDHALAADKYNKSNNLCNKGYALIRLEKYDEATAVLRDSIALEGNHLNWQHLGTALLNTNHLHEALEALDRSITFNSSTNRCAFELRGLVLDLLGQYESALDMYDLVLQEEPDNIRVSLSKTSVLSSLDRMDEALELCDDIIAISPELSEAWNQRTAILIAMERFSDAISTSDRWLAAVAPNNSDALEMKGRALIQQDRLLEAYRVLDRATTINPSHFKAWYSRGSTLALMGRFDDALVSYKRSLMMGHADDDTINSAIGTCLSQIGRPEEGLALVDKVLVSDPTSRFARATRAGILTTMGRHVEAALDWYDVDEIK